MRKSTKKRVESSTLGSRTVAVFLTCEQTGDDRTQLSLIRCQCVIAKACGRLIFSSNNPRGCLKQQHPKETKIPKCTLDVNCQVTASRLEITIELQLDIHAYEILRNYSKTPHQVISRDGRLRNQQGNFAPLWVKLHV